jgi:hypothetical protein
MLSSCATLNKGVTLHELEKKASPEVQLTLANPDFKSCKSGDYQDFGEVVLKNNLWGASKVKKGTPKLCTFKKDNFFGWKWEVPNKASGVIGYPALQLGNSPFRKITTIKNNLPVQISKIENLEVTYDFETKVKHKKFNLAFDIWLTNKQFSTKENIITEIMIWENYNSFTSYGKKQETIITPFGSYAVYVGYLKNPKFGQDWQYIAFVLDKNQRRNKATVNVGYFLNYLVKNNLISKKDYLATLELGNEIGNSSGFTVVKDFNWKLDIQE